MLKRFLTVLLCMLAVTLSGFRADQEASKNES
jgi:hypothetical protein